MIPTRLRIPKFVCWGGGAGEDSPGDSGLGGGYNLGGSGGIGGGIGSGAGGGGYGYGGGGGGRGGGVGAGGSMAGSGISVDTSLGSFKGGVQQSMPGLTAPGVGVSGGGKSVAKADAARNKIALAMAINKYGKKAFQVVMGITKNPVVAGLAGMIGTAYGYSKYGGSFGKASQQATTGGEGSSKEFQAFAKDFIKNNPQAVQQMVQQAVAQQRQQIMAATTQRANALSQQIAAQRPQNLGAMFQTPAPGLRGQGANPLGSRQMIQGGGLQFPTMQQQQQQQQQQHPLGKIISPDLLAQGQQYLGSNPNVMFYR